MPNFIDLTGKRFGKFVVKLKMNERKNGKVMWLCLCDCGNKRIVVGSNLINGRSRSCGCTSIEKNKDRSIHMVGHPIYNTWVGMIQRCKNINSDNYERYGGRGIKVCERWEKFINFLEDMGNSWKEGLTIDRINNNGNYELNNCKWSTIKEQNNNKRIYKNSRSRLGKFG